MGLSVSLPISVAVNQDSVLDLATGTASIAFLANYVFSSGTGAYQGTSFNSDTRTLGAFGVDTFTLYGGLTDIFGNVLFYKKIRAIIIENAVASSGSLSLFQGVANRFVGPTVGTAVDVLVRIGGVFMCVAPDTDGWPVVQGTGDVFNVVNTGGAASTYFIMMIGNT